MVVDVDRQAVFDCSGYNASYCWHRSLTFGVLRRLDAQPRLGGDYNKFIHCLHGGHYGHNNASWIRIKQGGPFC
jgi:hypothetical protein